MMKLIQVGITLIDHRGQLPMIDGAYCVRHFNLCNFDMRTDRDVLSSIELLKNSGIDFERNRPNGLVSRTLGSLLPKHGLVFNPRIHYVCYKRD
ncbi:hypothetical protein KP509_13G034700 [Ceratopteris richardii]|uniref:Uncharacterized protein n=1 Tax=Ceratopteris richardii TaxID=49495 RepID=A0A8T2TI29_CERRI|nr:hypothetical protein KP509_13G034700 [Ceratopteris richardii]